MAIWKRVFIYSLGKHGFQDFELQPQAIVLGTQTGICINTYVHNIFIIFFPVELEMEPSGKFVSPETKMFGGPERELRRWGSYQDLGTRKNAK